MATPSGTETAALIESLRRKSRRYEFFQAVRLLQNGSRDRTPVGHDASPSDESVRFEASTALQFPPVEVPRIEPGKKETDPPRMTVPFFGIASPSSFGSLPVCYSQLVISRSRDGDPALADFLDLFNHRLVSLFYRAWEKYRFDVTYESSPAGEGIFEKGLYALLGMGTAGLRRRFSFPDAALLPWVGHLSGRTVSAGQLEDLVSRFFGVTVDVEQFITGWYEMGATERLRLNRRHRGLGRDSFLGRQVCVAQFRFRLRIGPLDWRKYVDFLPIGDAFHALRDLVRLAVGPELDFDVQLVLKAEDASELRLQSPDHSQARLGWTTWLQSRPLDHDPSDVVLSSDWKPNALSPSS